VADALAGITVAHIDQTDESDAHFLTRLAKDYNAIATVKNGRLLFIQRGAGKTAGGSTLPTATIRREDGDRHHYRKAERTGKYTGVRARWLDRNAAKAYSILAGEEGTVKALRKTHTNEQEAWHAANSELKRLQRGGTELELTLATANLELMPEVPVKASGWKETIDAKKWIIAGPVTHKLEGALITSLTLGIEAPD